MLIRESGWWRCLDMVVVFNHVPKVGGNSIFRLFEEMFGEEDVFRHRIRFAGPDGRQRMIDELDDEELRKLKFCGGHFDYGNAERFRKLGLDAFYIGVMRSPVERFRSSYLHNRRVGRPDVREKYRAMSFEDLAKASLRKGESPYVTSGQIRALTGTHELEAAKSIVGDEYLCICTTEQLDDMQMLLARHFGHRIDAPMRTNVAPFQNAASLSAEVEAQLIDANRADYEFYDWISGQFEAVRNDLIGMGEGAPAHRTALAVRRHGNLGAQ